MNAHNFLPLVLGIVAVLGDKLLEITSEDLNRALVDSLSHGIIGLISWLIIALKSYKYKTYCITPLYDVILSWITASAIDIDHFISARSFKLKNALHLGEKRPILHCSTIPLMVLIVTNISHLLWRFPRVASFGWIIWVATFSHHVRDGYRRGLWFWPFGSTLPIPYVAYIVITMVLPHVTFIIMCNLQVFQPQPLYSNVSVV